MKNQIFGKLGFRSLVVCAVLLLFGSAALAQIGTKKRARENHYDDLFLRVNGVLVKINFYQPKIIMPRSKSFNTTYWNDLWPYKAGKIKSIDNITFDYYNDFWAYQAGKIAQYGDIKITYYSNFWDYNAGKIESIGGVKFEYNNNFWAYKAGKIASIGNIKFDYQNPDFANTEKPPLTISGDDERIVILD